MKKILFTLSAIALFLAASAQDKKTEMWPNGNKKSEGILIGSTADPVSSKEAQARQSAGIAKDGKWTNWFENGTVRTEEYYNKGGMIGLWKAWHA